MAILSRHQERMLRMTIEFGHCEQWTPSSYKSAWSVRVARGHLEEFVQPTGDAVLAQGFIELTATTHTGVRTVRRYEPTEAGITHIRRLDARRARRPSPKTNGDSK